MQANKITGRLCRSAGMPRILVNSLLLEVLSAWQQSGAYGQFLLGNVGQIRQATALLQRCPNCGERGSMREKGIDGRHAEADSLGLGNQPGTTPFVNASAFTVSIYG
jgi:hypothetical protein